MTVYSEVADSEIDPESPATTSLFTKLRNNPIAITEKASGAPVLASNYIVTAMIKNGEVTVDKLEAATAGNYLEGHYAYQTGAEIGDPSGSYTPVLELKAVRGGTYTVRIGIAETSSSWNVVGKIYVNGVAQGIERNPGIIATDNWAWWNENITVSEGALVQLYFHRGGSPSERAAGCIALLCSNPIAASTNYADIHALTTVNGAFIV